LLRRLGTVAYDLASRAILRLAPAAQIAGIRVSFLMWRGAPRDHATQTMAQALDLIAAYAPRRFAAVRREFAAILVYDCGPVLSLGQFNSRLHLCVVNAGYFHVQHPGIADTVIAASVLIHEAVHGRLARYGYIGDRLRNDRTLLHRVERVCVEAQLDFVSLLPGSESLQAHYRDRLQSIPDTYSEHTERAENRAALKELLRLLGLSRRSREAEVPTDRPAA
jgi:hypothetical protein